MLAAFPPAITHQEPSQALAPRLPGRSAALVLPELWPEPETPPEPFPDPCFPTQNPRFPGNLQMSDRQLDEAGENDVNNL